MNNSFNRIILGAFLPALYFNLPFLIIYIVEADSSQDGLAILLFIYLLMLAIGFIPTLIFSILIEIGNIKRFKHIYLYGACVGFLIGFVYCAEFSLGVVSIRNVLVTLEWATMGMVVGLLTTIPLHYLSKRELKKKLK